MNPKHSIRSDSDLIAAIHFSPQERERAMTYLWKDKALRNMAFSVLLKMLRDEDKAEEAFGESLVQFMLAVLQGKFRGDSTIRTYIVGICINLGKKAITRPAKYSEQEQLFSKEHLEQLDTETSDSPEQNYLALEYDTNLERLFQKLYRQLPAYCEKSLRWFYSGDYTVAEIATAEGMQEQSIKNRLSECRKKLREIIKQDSDAMKIIQQRK